MVFLDAGFLIALAVKNDQFHQSAEKILSKVIKNRARLITSNYVVQEAVTRIVYNAGFRTAKIFIDGLNQLEKEGLVNIIWIDRVLHNLSIEYLSKYKDHPFSFVDASIIAIVKKLNLEVIYTTDSVLKATGLSVILLDKKR